MTEVETWDDFIAAGKKATRDLDGDGKIDQYAIVLDRRTESDYFSLLLQQGGGFFDEDGTVIIDNELAIETLEFFTALFNKHGIATPGVRHVARRSEQFCSDAGRQDPLYSCTGLVRRYPEKPGATDVWEMEGDRDAGVATGG